MQVKIITKNNNLLDQSKVNYSRRKFLQWAIYSVTSVICYSTLAKATTLRDRYLFLYNLNIGESIHRVYWTPQDGYIHNSISEISWVLRDHHNNQVKQFDVSVLDQLYALQLQLGLSNSPVHVVSGYRSPSTNWMLCEQKRGVARNSYHMRAMAIDIRVEGSNVSDLYHAARSLGAGGVGYYPQNNFVHIDSGPIRYWS